MLSRTGNDRWRQALWAEINSGHCSGWNIALGIANIGLNGVTLFFSGKNFVSKTKTLNKMLKADGVYDKIGNWINGGSNARLNTYGDALRKKLGPAYLFHAEEYRGIKT